MAHTTKTPLGAATLNRKWYLDVNTGTYEVPVWTGVFGIAEFKAALEPTLQDDSDFDSEGYKSSTVTAIGWSLELKLVRKVLAASATAYDPGQEALRAAAAGMGAANEVDVRWYEVTSGGPKAEAYRGYATVSWVPDGGGMDALDTVTVTLTGKGARNTYTHPDGAPAAVPIISEVTPSTDVAAGGAIIMISGIGFTGTVEDGVKFGTTPATDFTVVSDNLIAAVAPAHAAGTVDISVENATGVSVVNHPFVYTS